MIILKNNSQNKIIISSLAAELNSDESIDLDYYNTSALLENEELKTLYNNGDIVFFFNSQEVNYYSVNQILTPITRESHDSLVSMRHADCISYQEIIKDSNGLTNKIIYYSDETKSLKIKEENIIRNIDGKIAQVVTSTYENNVLSAKEIQTIIRNNGRAENIVITRG